MRPTTFISILILQYLSTAYSKESTPPSFRGTTATRRGNENDDASKQIIGGNEVVPTRYPFMAGIIRMGSETPFCGGSLISPEWVLSAAHCKQIDALYVHIGRHNYSDSSEVYEEILIEEQIPHPLYDSNTLDYDYMLIKLKNPSNHTPVVIDTGDVELDFKVDMVVMGWGRTESGGEVSPVLQEVEIDYTPHSLCNIAYLPFGGITDNMICGRRQGRDSCQGDSGGPLIIKGNDAETDVLVGIVSWGVGCAFLFYPGVYAKAANAMDFIIENGALP